MSTAQVPTLEANKRTQTGTRYANRLRKAGRMPIVIYGHKQEPIHAEVDDKKINDLLHQHAHVLQVTADDFNESCLVKAVQWDHLSKHIIHVDLTRVDLNETVQTEVDITFAGEAIGLKQTGTYVDHTRNTLPIECLALNIPESIHVDVTDLDINKPLTASQLTLPQGITCTLDGDTTIAAIHISAVQAEDDETDEASTDSEPEVIGGKKEDDGDKKADEK